MTQLRSKCLLALTSLLALASGFVDAQSEAPWGAEPGTTFTPTIHHPNIAAVTLFAENPDIVTPIGIAVSPNGRVFVQENHTHKRDSSYQGPATDRILVFEDDDQDGKADRRSVFYEGHKFSTDLLFGPDGHLYVSTRWFVGRFRNAAHFVRAQGEPEKLVVCQTDGDYPHNGVGGLAIDPANPGWIAFGFGENLGSDYTFVGSDGVRLSGGAEGGSTYLCRTDGSELARQSTGHWNAFGMAYDLAGNLFSTDNDPNATPPNRLLHVVPAADFGYEYRYGRSGRHPLVCWYGEHPGTLGMIGALGEAACGLVPFGPGKLLSASWTDNRVDVHSLQTRGQSFVASRKPCLSGPDDFRPVHFAYSADGKYLYFTDWVKLSYPVHGYGRIWRVEFKDPVRLAPEPRTDPTQRLSPTDALGRLGDMDPYVRTEAIRVLMNATEMLESYRWQDQGNAVSRAHFAVAAKRSGQESFQRIIPTLLQDDESDVRFVGIKWIGDDKLEQYRTDLEKLLEREDLTQQDLKATVAALARISSETSKEFVPDDTMLRIALDSSKQDSLRALALRGISSGHKQLALRSLTEILNSQSMTLKREAVRSLALHRDPLRFQSLAKVAIDRSFDSVTRADAVAALAGAADEYSALLQELSQDVDAAVSQEANRSLHAAGVVPRTLQPKPSVNDLAAWQKLVDQADGEPDPTVGRRPFLSSEAGRLLQVPHDERTWRECWSRLDHHPQPERDHGELATRTHCQSER